MENTVHHSSHTPSYDSTPHLICASSQLAVSLAAHPSVAILSSNTVRKIGFEWGVHRDHPKNMCLQASPASDASTLDKYLASTVSDASIVSEILGVDGRRDNIKEGTFTSHSRDHIVVSPP